MDGGSTRGAGGRSRTHDLGRRAMTQFDETLASPEWAFALAATLEEQLADDRILTVGTRADLAELAGGRPAPAVELRFTTDDQQSGSAALLAFPALAEALKRAAPAGTLISD